MYSLGVKRYLFLEPTYFLFSLAYEIADMIDVNLFLQKACRNSTLFEPDLRTPCDSERNGIEFVALINSQYQTCGGIITIITIVLMSAWMDKAPNRPRFCILFSMWIRLLQMISLCLQAHFWYWPVLTAVFTELLLHVDICGRVFSVIYICNVSSMEDRTFRLTLLYVIELISSLIGSGISGYLLRHLGFFYSYTLCAALIAVSLAYAYVFWKNPDTENANMTSRGCVKASYEFFDVRSVVQAFRLVLRKRSGNERVIIILMSLINILCWVCFLGELSVLYLYLRYRFGWNEKDYGIYRLYKIAGICVGLVICLAISKCIKVEDSALGLFASLWDTVASVGYFYATEDWQLYLVLLFNIFHGFADKVCDSIQSKFFKNEEYGQLFSVHMSVNILIPLFAPLYSLIFQNTMDFAPNFIFILSFTLNISVGVLYGISHLLIRRIPKTD